MKKMILHDFLRSVEVGKAFPVISCRARRRTVERDFYSSVKYFCFQVRAGVLG